jgi:hypothetical protein
METFRAQFSELEEDIHEVLPNHSRQKELALDALEVAAMHLDRALVASCVQHAA